MCPKMSSTRTEISWGKTIDWNSFDFCFQYKRKLWKHDTLIVFGIWRWCCHKSHTGITSYCGSWAFILMLHFNLWCQFFIFSWSRIHQLLNVHLPVGMSSVHSVILKPPADGIAMCVLYRQLYTHRLWRICWLH